MSMPIRLAMKVDVDTDRGTREGVPNSWRLPGFKVPGVFFFRSVRTDRTGNHGVFAPGFSGR